MTSIDPILLLEIVAAVFGVLGTVVLALNGPRAGMGFIAYLVSNACWLTSSWVQGQWPFFAQQIVFMACSALGVWIWIVRPSLDAVDKLFDF
jgi:hypothetical protein